jgi:hypothetical protein
VDEKETKAFSLAFRGLVLKYGSGDKFPNLNCIITCAVSVL